MTSENRGGGRPEGDRRARPCAARATDASIYVTVGASHPGQRARRRNASLGEGVHNIETLQAAVESAAAHG